MVFFEAPHRIQTTLRELAQAVGERPAVIGRELTKIHEEFVRGPISTLIDRLEAPRGEFTIVVDIGQTTDFTVSQPPGPDEIAREFGEMTESSGLTRRAIVTAIAKRRRLSAREVYGAIEESKKLGQNTE